MAIRRRITWGTLDTIADPRLKDLPGLVRQIRKGGLPRRVKGGKIFRNDLLDLPQKGLGHYREFDVETIDPGLDRGPLRLVLGADGEVFVTGNHYADFRQIINLPE